MQQQGPRQRGAFGQKSGLSVEGNVDNEEQRLDAMLAALARGPLAEDAWEKLHEEARQRERISELAFGFESVSQGKRLKAVSPSTAAEFLFQAARFFGEVFGDDVGSVAYLERALALVPTHAPSFAKLEELLGKAEQPRKLAELYASTAQHRPRAEQAAHLRHAAELFARAGGADDKVVELLQQVLRFEPADDASRSALEALFMKANRFRDVVRLDEQALANDPPPNPAQRARLLERIVLLYAEKLQEPERALPHVEQLLVLEPTHEGARHVAQRLIVVKGLAGRAAAALATAYEASGASEQVAHYLALELESTRGPKRAALYARLGRLKQDRLGDPTGAFESFEQALAIDADDELRSRYVGLALFLRRHADATKTLTRVLATVKEPATRAKVGAQLGEVLLRAGDPKRAKAPLATVLSSAEAPAEAVLAAALVLREILEAEKDAGPLCDVLERIATLEPDLEKRREVDERLSDLAIGRNEIARAIPAFERLLSTSSRARALEALGPLYEASGDRFKHAGLLEERAKDAPNPSDARALMMKAAEVRATETEDATAAIATCQAIMARFGTARDVLALLLPLLESQRLWTELAEALVEEVFLTDGAPKAQGLARLGLVRLQRLRDAPGAIRAMNEALGADPHEKTARATLEKLAAAGELRLAAARALEPIYRAEGARASLLRVLDLRGALAPDSDERLEALREAADLAAAGAAEPARALELIARGLAEAVGSEKPAAEWLERLDGAIRPGGDGARRAAILASALGSRAVTTEELLVLAKRTAEALAASGDAPAATAVYRRALAFEPQSTELLSKVDDLLRDQGSPSERIALYRSALERAPPSGRRELLHRIGTIQRNDLGDLGAAIETYRIALNDDGDDVDAQETLEELFVQAGRVSDLCALLEARLVRLEGDPARAVRVKLAQLSAAHGDGERARKHCARLLGDLQLAAEHLDAVERAAEQLGDADLLRASLQRRAEMAVDPGEQIAWLDKLAVLDLERRNDPTSAAASWKRAARLAEATGDDEGARRLYSLARKAAPDDAEITARLASLCERAELWAELPRLYVALANQSADDDERVDLALRAAAILAEKIHDPRAAARSAARAFDLSPGRADVLQAFERLSVAAGAIEAFEQTIAHVLARPQLPSGLDVPQHVRILLARARTLAGGDARADEAADAYRALLDDPRLDDANRADALKTFESLVAREPGGKTRRADRRWLLDWHAGHAPPEERVTRWLAWAREEEVTFDDPERALALYTRVLDVEPDCDEALSSVARLALAAGKIENALAALSALRDRAEGPARTSVEREIARVLVERTERHGEALESLRLVLAEAPSDPEALALASRLLGHRETRAEASVLLERAEGATDDVDARDRILTELLATEWDPSAANTRRGWFERLCDLQRDHGRNEAALHTAVRAAREMPGEGGLWDRAEALARHLAGPDEVAALYEEVFAGPLGREHAVSLGERAVSFFEEWFEDSAQVVRILDRVLDVDPAAGWAFDRLKLLLDAAERWDDLFAAYDRALASATGPERVTLLEDAAQTAKDFADRPDRAIGYFEQLRVLRPADGKLASALERLYERQGKHRALVDLLSARLPSLAGDEERRARTRVASLWLDDLQSPGPALDVLEPLLERDAGTANKVAADSALLLERILAVAPQTAEPRRSTAPPASESGRRPKRTRTSDRAPSSYRSVRQRAAAWLRRHYAALGSDSDLARMLLVELETMSRAKDRVRRHVQVAELFEQAGDLPGAFEQTSLAVLAGPDDETLRAALVDLAERAGRIERLAEVVAAAASTAETASLSALLTLQAASLRAERLGDAAGAIALLVPVLADRGVSDEDALAAARKLEPLLEAAGRVEERLAVIERIASSSQDLEVRREALGKAARLAVVLGQDARAIALWEGRLAMDERDADALDHLVELLGREREQERLAEVLSARARVATSPEARRADLVRLATLIGEVLARPPPAIDAWRAIESEFGPADDTTQALAGLLQSTERWHELAELLESSAGRTTDAMTRAARLTRLGDVRRERLHDAAAAVNAYATALAADPGHEEARSGLRTMAHEDAQRAEAIAVLLRALRARDDWNAILGLTPLRLRAAASAEDRLAILHEAARIAEEHAGDPGAAFDALRHAFAIAPSDPHLQAEVTRLAEATGRWDEFVEAHREAIEGAASGDAELALRLWRNIGIAREGRLHDPKGALDAYLRAIALGTDSDGTLAASRVAAGLGEWDVAARVLVDLARAMGSASTVGLEELERIAGESGAWDDLTRALAERVSTGGLEKAAARDLVARVAEWHLHRRGDESSAEEALELALSHDPANAALLAQLAQLRRRRPDGRLVDTLIALSDATGGRLSLLREACEIAIATGDRGLAVDLAGKVLELARARWDESGERTRADGTEDPPATAEWAIETLARLHDEGADARALLDVLVLGEALPFDPSVRLGMRRRAARTALDRLNDAERAIALYGPIFELDPRDAEAAPRLAAIYAAKGRTRDLLQLRQRQIEASPDPGERIPLRLEAGRWLVELGEGPQAVEMFRANLVEQPSDRDTVERLAAALAAEARAAELRDLYCSQAEIAERAENGALAADFWGRAAAVAEDPLQDPAAAALYHARVVSFTPRAASFEALARLAHDRGDHADAAGWLERWLEVEPQQRIGATLRLAESLVLAGQPDAAAARIERSLAQTPDAEPLRARLAALYRERGDWSNLARATAEAAAHAPDKATRMARLLEAAELFASRCAEPARAVPLLEQASDLTPEDQAVRLALARALADAGRKDDARAILRLLIDAFGGRRPRERAPVHYQMARLELESGNRARALMELDTAARVDPQNAEILGTLARLAREDGQFERAEKSYRALLVVLRRREDARDADAFARSEVLLELSAIAERRGESERSKELLESAIETATESDFERGRFESVLRERGAYATLARVLELGLSRSGDTPESAHVLAELATVLVERLGEHERALSVRMRAVRVFPGSPGVHAAALALAREAGRVDRYMDGVAALIEEAVARSDTALAAALLVRLGSVVEADVGDPRRAISLYENAIGHGQRSPELLDALDRVYAELGEVEDRARVLALRVEVATQAERLPEAAEALYRLAALRLDSARTLDEGTELLRRALDLAPNFAVAESALRAATAIDPTHPGALALYEQVGREPGHERALVDALCLRARLPGAGGEIVREAVSVASRANEPALVEALLERFASEPATKSDPPNLTWALETLASLREAAGDLRGAMDLKRQAAESAEPEAARRFQFEIARIAAGKLGDLEVAAAALEALHRADPADREAWEPLADVYRRRGDVSKLVELLGSVIDYVDDMGERARLRLERVRAMVDHLSLEDARAAPLLREILDDDASQVDAAFMLAAILERAGAHDDLAELLGRQVDAAKDRSDAAAVASLTLRLGALLESKDRVQTRNLYYAGLDWDPKNRALLEALLRLLQGEADAGDRADLLERVLGLEQGAGAEAMAEDLHALRTAAGDDRGAERALILGFRAFPASERLRGRLEKAYRARGDWKDLAELCILDASARPDPAERVARLREAAHIYRTELCDPRTAAATLGQARVFAPDDADLLRDEVDLLIEGGDPTTALATLGREIDPLASNDPRRARLLAVRAGIRSARAERTEAIEDLEAAFSTDPAAYASRLVAELQHAIDAAESSNDGSAGAAMRLRQAEVLVFAGDPDAARTLLVNLVRKDPKDRAALRKLASLEVACERWETASAVWRRLVALEEGEASIEAAVALADACARAGRPADARGVLERARLVAPNDRAVRAHLERVYEGMGAWHELARMALEDAGKSPDVAERFALLVQAGSWLLKRGEDPAGAMSALQQALALRPTDPECVALLVDAYLTSTRVSDAAALLESFLAPHKTRRSRELGPIYWRLAQVVREQGDEGNEIHAMVQALECDSQNGDICGDVAVRAMDLGQIDLATRALRAVTLLRVPGLMSKALAYQYLGELARRQGDSKRALTLLRRAMTEDPDLEGTQAIMDSIKPEA